jgi:hypothetical protein
MSVTANGPDGSTFSFPDGTPQEVVRGALAKHYGWSDAQPQQRPPDATDPWAKFTPAPEASAVPADPWAQFKLAPQANAPPAAPARMPIFRVQGPDGKLYNVEAPDAESAVAALHGSGQTPSSTAPVEDKGALTADNIVRSLANGITFGGADRLAAFLGSKTGVGGEAGNYEGNLAKQRELTDAYATEHPIANAAGNIAGNVAGLAAATAIPGVAAALPDAAPTMLGKIGQGAAAGAGVGAIQGANEAPDWSNVGETVNSTTRGAGAGAIFGSGFPLVAKGVGKSYSALADSLGDFGPTITKPAGRILAKALRASDPGAVEAQAAALGPAATLLDAAPSMLRKGQGAAGNSEEAQNILAAALRKREAGTTGRLTSDVNDNFGTAVEPIQAQADIAAHRSKVDEANYGAALGQSLAHPAPPPVDISPVVDRVNGLIGDSAPGTDIHKALSRVRDMLHAPNPDAADATSVAPPLSSAPPMPPKPQTLVNFIQNAGGMRDTNGDLKSLGHTRFPGLVTNKGLDPDLMREMAHEAGFLGDGTSDSIGETTVQDLLDKLEQHPTHSAHDSDILDAWQRANDARTGADGSRISVAEYRARYTGRDGSSAPPSTVPQTRADLLHEVKKELDKAIEYPDEAALGLPGGALKTGQARLKQARFALNDALEKQVPGYADANAASAALAKRGEAVASGSKLLRADAPWPDRVAGERATMQPGERAAQAMGLRGAMESKIRNTANDITAGKYIVGGEGDFNRDTLGHVFGQEPTQNFVGAVERERKFADTSNRILGNSETAPRAQAIKEMAPFRVGTVSTIGHALSKAVDKFGGGAIDKVLGDVTKSYPEVARILSSSGSERDAYVRALRASETRSGASAVTGQKIGNRSALAAALLANGATRPGPPQRRLQGNSR